MTNSYQAVYPGDLAVSPEIVQFFEDFYRISDIPGEHDRYVDQFTQDAIFILASKKSHGKQGLSPHFLQQHRLHLNHAQKSWPQESACGPQ